MLCWLTCFWWSCFEGIFLNNTFCIFCILVFNWLFLFFFYMNLRFILCCNCFVYFCIFMNVSVLFGVFECFGLWIHTSRPEDHRNLKKTPNHVFKFVCCVISLSLCVFQALGCCYFLHESLKNIQQFDFKGTCAPLISSISSNPERSRLFQKL